MYWLLPLLALRTEGRVQAAGWSCDCERERRDGSQCRKHFELRTLRQQAVSEADEMFAVEVQPRIGRVLARPRTLKDDCPIELSACLLQTEAISAAEHRQGLFEYLATRRARVEGDDGTLATRDGMRQQADVAVQASRRTDDRTARSRPDLGSGRICISHVCIKRINAELVNPPIAAP